MFIRELSIDNNIMIHRMWETVNGEIIRQISKLFVYDSWIIRGPYVHVGTTSKGQCVRQILREIKV